MAMIKCPECNNDISDTAKKCVHCGYKFKKEINKKLTKTIIISVISLIVIIASIVTIILIVNKGNEQRRKREEEKAEMQRIKDEEKREKEYRDDFYNLAYDILSGAAEVEKCGNLIRNVWYNTIWEEDDSETDMYTKNNGVFYDDFNDALGVLFASETYKEYVKNINKYKTDTGSAILKLSDHPTKYDDSYNDLKEFYDDFISFSNSCLNPIGSYNTYSSNFTSSDNQIISSYDKVKPYLDEFFPNFSN